MTSTLTLSAGLVAAAVVTRPSSGSAVSTVSHATAGRLAHRSCGRGLRRQPASMIRKPWTATVVTKPYGFASMDRWFTTRRPLEVSR